jgi:hypothetical protein
MMAQVHHNYPFLTIYWVEEDRCVWLEWKAFVRGAEFRGALEDGLKLLKQKASIRWLADTRHIAALDAEDKVWTSKDWFPRVIAAGLRKMAIVSPEKMIPMMSVDDVIDNTDLQGLEVRYFDTLEEARTWLRRPPLTPTPPDSQARA